MQTSWHCNHCIYPKPSI